MGMKYTQIANIQRESNFELLRILSQVFIVLYHICYIWQGKEYSSQPFFQAVSIPLHIGVVVFVLLSGYFTIKLKASGLVKLLGIFFVYCLPEVIYSVATSKDALHTIRSLMFFSNSHFWFVKTYLYLFLVSPMINLWLEHASERQRWYMVAVFAFVACYMAISRGDTSVTNGKNLTNFIYFYLVGNQLYYYRDWWMNIKTRKLLLFYFIFNIVILTLVYFMYGNVVGKIINSLSFPYSSPMILIGAIMFFMIIGKQHIQSRFINYVAASSLAIYLIHGSRPYLPEFHGAVCGYLQGVTDNNMLLFGSYTVYTLIVITACVCIDKCLTPVWNTIYYIGSRLQEKFSFFSLYKQFSMSKVILLLILVLSSGTMLSFL